MEKTDLANYLALKVELGLANGMRYKGFLVALDELNATIESSQYASQKIILIKDIISIKVLLPLWQRFGKRFWK